MIPTVRPPPLSPLQIAAAKVVAAQAREVETRELPPGIVCKRCRCTKWSVLRTRPAPGEIIRRRRCLRCRHVRYTFER